jgi:hypothetical protein
MRFSSFPFPLLDPHLNASTRYAAMMLLTVLFQYCVRFSLSLFHLKATFTQIYLLLPWLTRENLPLVCNVYFYDTVLAKLSLPGPVSEAKDQDGEHARLRKSSGVFDGVILGTYYVLYLYLARRIAARIERGGGTDAKVKGRKQVGLARSTSVADGA